jgi:hypothetical protein
MRRRMIVFAAVVAAVCTAPSAVFAALVFQDTFTKADQALLGTTPNIGGNWTITGTSVVNPLAIVSNAVPLNTTGQDAFAPFSAPVPNTAGAIRTSADINLSAVGSVVTGDYFLHLSDPAGTTSFFFQRLGAAPAPAGGYFLTFAATAGGGATTSTGTTALNLNTTYHVDIDWNFVSGALNDTFQVSVNGSSYLSKTWDSTNAEPPTVSAVNFRQGTAGSAPNVTVDNLTVEQIPEPATLVLASMIGLVGLACRRSR